MDIEERIKKLKKRLSQVASQAARDRANSKHYVRKRLVNRQREIWKRLIVKYQHLSHLEQRVKAMIGSFSMKEKMTGEPRYVLRLTQQELQKLRYILRRKNEFRPRKVRSRGPGPRAAADRPSQKASPSSEGSASTAACR